MAELNGLGALVDELMTSGSLDDNADLQSDTFESS